MIGHRPAAEAEISDARDAVARGRGPDGPADAGHRPRRAAARQPRVAALGRVADRCLTCGNCTMVCPTCFCTTHRGQHQPDRGRRRGAVPALGVLLRARLLLPARRQRAGLGRQPLPAVDHAQAEHLARPVRRVRLRRLRPVHRVVPGRPSTSPRKRASSRGLACRVPGAGPRPRMVPMTSAEQAAPACWRVSRRSPGSARRSGPRSPRWPGRSATRRGPGCSTRARPPRAAG